MNTRAEQWFQQNNVVAVSIIEEDTFFDRCDASKEYSDCLQCEVANKEGFTWQVDLATHIVCEFLNGE